MTKKPALTRRKKPVGVGDVCNVLAAIAPPSLAADWDNVGLLIGRRSAPVRRLLLTIDLTESVLKEAGRIGAEMVMAYHPPIFKPISRLTDESAAVAYEAARAGLAVYSMHTAWDAADGGINDVLAEAIGLVETVPLEPAVRGGLFKVVVFVPGDDLSTVARACFDAGAGRIGRYTECSFASAGVGTFRGGAGSCPTKGRAGRLEEVAEIRVEVVVPGERLAEVLAAIRGAHGYETPAIDVYPLRDMPEGAGMGRVGRLARPVSSAGLVARVKRALGVRRVLIAGRNVRKVATAACGVGSGGSMFRAAARASAQAFVTGQMRHHDALAAAAAGLTVICAGHSNSERIALWRLAEQVRAELPALDVRAAAADKDPFEIV